MNANDHIGKGSPHREWNREWKMFRNKNPNATAASIWQQLDDMFGDPKFSDWLSKGMPASSNYHSKGSVHLGTMGVIATSALATISVGNLALNAKSIACNLMNDAINIKAGVIGAEIDLHQHMQEMAPGIIGHLAFLKVYGDL